MTIIDKQIEMVIIQQYLHENNLFENITITYPDPPDCIFENDKIDGWIEVTSVFKMWKNFTPTLKNGKVFGKYEYEFPTNNNEYTSEIIGEIIAAIYKKDSNRSYESSIKKFGLGILIIYINDACFRWKKHLNTIINPDNFNHLKLKKFKAVYIYNYPAIAEQVSFHPIKWQSRVLTEQDSFYLIWR